MNRIIKGNKVMVISGVHKGCVGVVKQIFPKTNSAIVDGVKKVYKHQKSENAKDGIIQKESPIPLCKLALTDKSGNRLKVKFQFNKDGKKEKIVKSTGKEYSS